MVVVGGVGVWLDVADTVVLMRDYRAGDGLAKARSVSYQFSYGHVQYGGRGRVVHRLPWEVKEDKKRVLDGDGVEAMEEEDDGDEDEKQEATLSPLRRRPRTRGGGGRRRRRGGRLPICGPTGGGSEGAERLDVFFDP